MTINPSHISELVSQSLGFLKTHKKGMVYLECEGLYDLEISFVVEPVEKGVEEFLIDANFYRKDLAIEITLVYNPKFGLKGVKWIEWALNEVLAHELCHFKQLVEGRLPKRRGKELSANKYFLQPHEVEAQIEGWERASTVFGDSVEDTAEIWFNRNKPLHGLEEKEYKKIIQKIFLLRKDLVL